MLLSTGHSRLVRLISRFVQADGLDCDEYLGYGGRTWVQGPPGAAATAIHFPVVAPTPRAHTAAMSCWAAGRRSSAENAGAGGANNKPVAARAGKRVALGDITNVFRGRGRSSGAASSAPEAVRLFLSRSIDRARRVPPDRFSFRERTELGFSIVRVELQRGWRVRICHRFWCTPRL